MVSDRRQAAQPEARIQTTSRHRARHRMHILFLAQRNIKRWTAKVAKVAKMPRGPYAFESGALKGRRCIWGGRANVRQALYMAEMSASNWNPELKAFHDRLAAAGKEG